MEIRSRATGRYRLCRAGRVAALLLVLTFSAARSEPALAVFHLTAIDEVLTSYGGNAAVQFVEMRMLAGGQNFVDNAVFAAFGPEGSYVGDILVVPSNLARGGSGVRWLIGTQAFQTVSGLTPDFIMPAGILPAAGGMICFGGGGGIAPLDPSTWQRTNFANYLDCLAYGTYSGPSNQRIGDPTPLDPIGHSLQRTTSTANNAADFACANPATPQNNAAAFVDLPATTSCTGEPSPTDTPPPTATATPRPTATNTPEPTDTVAPSPTMTSSPTVTAAASPTPTSSPTPTPSAPPGPPRNFAYVVTFGNPDSVRVVDTLTNTLTSLRIDLELGGEFVSISPDGRIAYASGQNGLTVIDTAANTVIKELSVFEPSGIERPVGRVAFSRDGSTAYVVNGDPAALSAIDTSVNEVTDAIPLEGATGDGPPGGIGVTSNGIVYATPLLLDAQSSIVAVDVAARSVVSRIASPCALAISQDLALALDERRVYVPLFGCRQGSLAGTGTGVQENCPGDCNGNDVVSVDELITAVNIALGTSSDGACPNLGADAPFVIDELVRAVGAALNGCFQPPQPFEGNGVAVIRTGSNTIFRVIPFGSLGPGAGAVKVVPQPRGASPGNGTGIEITPDGRSLYVAGCDIANLVCVVDTSTDTVRARIPAFVSGQVAYDVAITPDGRLAYVSQSTGSQVAVIDVRTNTMSRALFVPESRGVAAGRRAP
jgi:hypothetical protein